MAMSSSQAPNMLLYLGSTRHFFGVRGQNGMDYWYIIGLVGFVIIVGVVLSKMSSGNKRPKMMMRKTPPTHPPYRRKSGLRVTDWRVLPNPPWEEEGCARFKFGGPTGSGACDSLSSYFDCNDGLCKSRPKPYYGYPFGKGPCNVTDVPRTGPQACGMGSSCYNCPNPGDLCDRFGECISKYGWYN